MKTTPAADILQVDALLTVTNDTFYPELIPGDLVFIQNKTPADGQITLLEIGGDMGLFRVHYSREGLQLSADNSKYPPITVNGSDILDVHIIGVMAGFVRLINEKSADVADQRTNK